MRDHAKDALPRVLPLGLRDRLGHLAVSLGVTGRRLQPAPGLDAATRQDAAYVTARAGTALDLARPTAARHAPERLRAIVRRCGVEPPG